VSDTARAALQQLGAVRRARYSRATRRRGHRAATVISFVAITWRARPVVDHVGDERVQDRSSWTASWLNGHAYVARRRAATPERTARPLRATPGVTQAIPVVEQQVLVEGASLGGAFVRGLTRADLAATEIVSKNIKSGSLEGFGEGEFGGDLILVGARLAETMGVRAGDPLRLISPTGGSTPFGSTPRSKTYTVGGVFEVGMSEYDAAFIYMPMEQAQLFFGRGGSIDTIEVKLEDPDAVERLKAALERAAGPSGVVTDWTDRNRSFFGALEVERNVMRLILMLLVAIAAMNIISGLVMLVKNKGRDIAILRTMGATRSSILRIFLMAGASIGAAGTLAGLLIGTLFCIYIEPIQNFVEYVTGTVVFSADQYFLSSLPADVEWGEVAIIVSWSLLASVVATLPPAWRASRLDPVEALRYE
jgi:lipoprotein-releasing system permease protein